MLAGHTDPDPQGFVESCSEVVSDIIIFFLFFFKLQALCAWFGPHVAALALGQIIIQGHVLHCTVRSLLMSQQLSSFPQAGPLR